MRAVDKFVTSAASSSLPGARLAAVEALLPTAPSTRSAGVTVRTMDRNEVWRHRGSGSHRGMKPYCRPAAFRPYVALLDEVENPSPRFA